MTFGCFPENELKEHAMILKDIIKAYKDNMDNRQRVIVPWEGYSNLDPSGRMEFLGLPKRKCVISKWP